MKWFKHDTCANMDPRLQKILSQYGLEGYGLYWYCVELINSQVSEKDVSFTLQHDAEGIARNTNNTPHKVESMMREFLNLELFELDEHGNICCPEYAMKLDTSMTSNRQMRLIIQEIKSRFVEEKEIEKSIEKGSKDEIDRSKDEIDRQNRSPERSKNSEKDEIDREIDRKKDFFDTETQIDPEIDRKNDFFDREIDREIDQEIEIDTEKPPIRYESHDSCIEKDDSVQKTNNRSKSHDKIMQEGEGERDKDLKRSCTILDEIVPNHDFETFWNLYQRKVNKPACQKKWAKLKPGEIYLIFKTVKDYVKSTPVKKYRMNPLTYLNNYGWNNEIIDNESTGGKHDFSWMDDE